MISLNVEECLKTLANVGKQEEYVGNIVRKLHYKPAKRLRKLATMAYHGSKLAASPSPDHVIVNGKVKTWEEVDNM
jgi:hypothetical protein